MAKKRKRCQSSDAEPLRAAKLVKKNVPTANVDGVRVPVKILSTYYKKVVTLRDFLLARLPPTSTGRRKKLSHHDVEEIDTFLESTLIGVLQEPTPTVTKQRHQEFTTFSQTQLKQTVADSGRAAILNLPDLVDFAVWLSFQGATHSTHRPGHILCHGLQRRVAPSVTTENVAGPPTYFPGICVDHPNENRDLIKGAPWTIICACLGADAESLLLSLLLDCGIFLRLRNGHDNYFQLSGVPISSLESSTWKDNQATSGPNQIRLPLAKVLYARPVLDTSGRVVHTLHKSHVLCQHHDLSDDQHSLRLIQCIFPRQFGTENSKAESTRNLRNDEKQMHLCQRSLAPKHRNNTWLPRRLRKGIVQIVKKLSKRHKRCAYTQALRYYCPLSPTSQTSLSTTTTCAGNGEALRNPHPAKQYPVRESTTDDDPLASLPTSPEEISILQFASPVSMVSAFCQNIIRHLLPSDMLGRGRSGHQNLYTVMQYIDRYLNLRKFEYLSLHALVQGLSVNAIAWMQVDASHPSTKLCASERAKRLELLGELMQFIFDSLLIPLIRANFYVTESGTQRNRIHYFRHDVWQKLCEPTLSNLRLGTYSTVTPAEAQRLLRSRSLGCSYVRLLPKERGLRTITNLRRKMVRLVQGKSVAGPGINAQLAPLFNVFNYEKQSNPTILGSALLCAGDVYSKLQAFRLRIPVGLPLYFAKVDVQSCFDSIPQDKLLGMTTGLLPNRSYRMTKQLELRYVDSRASNQIGRPMRRFTGLARPADNAAVLSESSANAGSLNRNQVVVSDTGNQQTWSSDSLHLTLENHIKTNMIKIGKRHLRQTVGIPQGSVLSTMLCSAFYSAFEAERLQFLQPDDSLLLRMVDDFLLISTSKEQAQMFVEVMSGGDVNFGISINPSKTLTNFDASIRGSKPLLAQDVDHFPYCGITINTRTLEIGRDREKKDLWVGNSLTVDVTRRPGMAFQRKILAALKMQLHSMMVDTSINSVTRILSTLVGTFSEVTMKLHRHVANFQNNRRPSLTMIRGLIEELIMVTVRSCHHQAATAKLGPSKGRIRKDHIQWAAAVAFHRVLSRKQSLYRPILDWLERLRFESQSTIGIKADLLENILECTHRDFKNYVY